jgi:hypothetical protein
MPTLLQASVPGSGLNRDVIQRPDGDAHTGKVCIPNISVRERRKRLVGGVISFAIGLAVLAALMALGADRWWRLALFPLFAGATSGFFQWRDKT